MNKLLKRTLYGIIFVIVLVFLCIVVYILYHLKISQEYLATYKPRYSGELSVKGISTRVTVKRDDNGVPHIYADNEGDAWFALGYVMAQDRLFQMDFYRKLSQGRLSEIVGPPAVKYDKILRTLRLRKYAEEVIDKYSAEFSPLRDSFEAFIRGINTFIETQILPPEFLILHYRPEPFNVVDCLTSAMIMPVTFADGLRQDLVNLYLKLKYPDEDFSVLSCGYHRETPITIMESVKEAEEYLKSQGRDLSNWGLPSASNNNFLKSREYLLANIENFISTWQDLVNFMGIHWGSNSWVVSGMKTKSGKPILASDPHIGFLQPAVWYQVHLVYQDYDLYGFYMPPIPVPLMGQNTEFAWALTMFASDDHDLYIEILSPNEPLRVKYRGDWVPVIRESETIKVRFGSDVTFERLVSTHGVIVTQAYETVLDYFGPQVSLYWVWQHVPYTDVLAFYKMSHAKDIFSFREGVSLVTSPGVNVSYVDSKGNIAWWVGGKIPIRPDHVNPKYPLDGASGRDEVLGFVPFELNPHLVNPPWGYIVTANNLSTVKPVGEVEELQGYWEPSDRAQRIEELLEKRNDWTIEDMKSIQLDTLCIPGQRLTKILLELLESEKNSFTERERNALELLGKWDFHYETDRVGASIFTVLSDAVLRNLLIDELGEKMFEAYCTVADRWNFYKYILGDETSFLWDDRTTENVRETRKDIVVKSFKETVSVLCKKLGDNPGKWHWGKLHTLEFKHPLGYIPLLRSYFNVGPFECPGSYHTVNNMPYIAGTYNYEVVAGPSTRRLIDFSQPERVLEILPSGNSGIPLTKWYSDQAERFIKGEYREARITKEQIEKNTVYTLTLVPLN
ncbi:MAG: penicillin acylase family protein [Candidatus Hydrogenedentes bacterium]|nr:penicillin acylase family protein [Candidatus Hydrogenedentota bacterium]